MGVTGTGSVREDTQTAGPGRCVRMGYVVAGCRREKSKFDVNVKGQNRTRRSNCDTVDAYRGRFLNAREDGARVRRQHLGSREDIPCAPVRDREGTSTRHEKAEKTGSDVRRVQN